jgi:hypothetical protein
VEEDVLDLLLLAARRVAQLGDEAEAVVVLGEGFFLVPVEISPDG